jgi:CHAT domain-containing protein
MLDEVAFSLNRLNRVQGSDASRLAAAEMLFEVAAELSELLLPPIVGNANEPVVIVPTAVLHDVPWGLLPPLGGRAVSVNPSVSAWARAERTRQERAAARTGLRSVGFMAGPGLDFAEFEVENLSKLYIEPEVYVGATATSDACVDLLRRADVVHIACHGSFRTDNPMFSSLHLADGPVIVHDLERLHRLPETVILPACSVGTTNALQGGSLLGLAAALTTLGACNVIAPLTPINDAASVTVMDRLHHELIAGASPAAALAVAALEHDLTDPTAGAFITLGA